MLQISSIWQDDCVFVSELVPIQYLPKTRGALHLAKLSPRKFQKSFISNGKLFFHLLQTCKIVQFQEKNPHPPQVRSSEIPRGRGVLKAKILEAKHDAKVEFPSGGGGDTKQKTFCGESMNTFWNCTISLVDQKTHMMEQEDNKVEMQILCIFLL